MKKIKVIFTFLFLALVSPCLMVGCASGNSVPFIDYKDNYIVIQKYYYVGDEIELNDQHIKYYKDRSNNVPTESDVKITKDMISSFSTRVAGNFVLKINYKGASINFDYVVFEKPDFSLSYGSYSSKGFEKNTIVEINQNKVVIKYYKDGYSDETISNPTTETAVDYSIKPNKTGEAIIAFEYNDVKYEFRNLDSGVFKKIKRSKYVGGNISSSEYTCSKIG